MQAAVFDTNILIDYLNGNLDAKKLLEKYEHKIISVITYIEVLCGASSDEENIQIKAFISKNFEILELDSLIAEEVVDLRAKSIAKRRKLKLPDCIILATANTQGINLITRNSSDFKDFDNVLMPYKV